MEKDVSSYREYEAQSRDLERQNLALGKEVERLNTIIRNNSHEAEDYRTRINRLEGNINEYKNIEYRVKEFENKIAMLVQENERLNGLIRTKNDDIEQLEKEKLQLHS